MKARITALFASLAMVVSASSVGQQLPCKPYWDLLSSGGNRTTSNQYILTSSIGQITGNPIALSDSLILQGWHQNFYFCGDPNGSGNTTVSDAVFLIDFIFGGGSAPIPYGSGDIDCNGIITISDAVYLIAYVFSGGPSPCEFCPCGI